MQIAPNQVVSFHYQVRDESGELLESSHDSVPLTILHSHGNLLPALEQAMLGREVGDEFSATLSPQEAYGEAKPGMTQRVPTKQLKGARQWKPGMVAILETPQGNRPVTVLKVGKFMADIDLNHPQAGKTLKFELKIMDVREPSAEELTHGHAHGPGGHQH